MNGLGMFASIVVADFGDIESVTIDSWPFCMGLDRIDFLIDAISSNMAKRLV